MTSLPTEQPTEARAAVYFGTIAACTARHVE